VLSAYSFGFMGAAGLVGAPLSGILAERIGSLMTCAVAGGTMLVVVICMILFTNVQRME